MTFGNYPVDPFFIEAASVFLVAFGLLALIGLCWNWISKWRWVSNLLASKAQEFGCLYQDIVERRDELISMLDETPSAGKALTYYARLVELEKILLGLGIATPPTPPAFHDLPNSHQAIIEWGTFLMMMARDARTNDLKAARKQK